MTSTDVGITNISQSLPHKMAENSWYEEITSLSPYVYNKNVQNMGTHYRTYDATAPKVVHGPSFIDFRPDPTWPTRDDAKVELSKYVIKTSVYSSANRPSGSGSLSADKLSSRQKISFVEFSTDPTHGSTRGQLGLHHHFLEWLCTVYVLHRQNLPSKCLNTFIVTSHRSRKIK